CVVPWPKGADNGGATTPGVTADKIKVVVTYGDGANDNRQAWLDALEPFQRFYRTWGRTVDVTFYKNTGTDEVAQRADAVAIANTKPFAVWIGSPFNVRVLVDELAAKRIIVLGSQVPVKDALNTPGYMWGDALPGPEPYLAYAAEYAGRRLVSKAARWAGDATMRAQPR